MPKNLVKKNLPSGQRTSVSAEVYGAFNKRENYVPKVVKKNEGQVTRIRQRLIQAFMFSALDEKEKKIVIDAMEERSFKAGDRVITQGQDGEVLYVVDSGLLDCYKRLKKDAPETFIKTYQPGESFGELALLYNAPRAASIIAKEDSVCFSLDRECFNFIVKDAAIKKRERYIDFLTRVEILDSLDAYEKAKVCDCLTSSIVQSGEYVIKEVGRIDGRASKETPFTLSRKEKQKPSRRMEPERKTLCTSTSQMTISENWH